LQDSEEKTSEAPEVPSPQTAAVDPAAVDSAAQAPLVSSDASVPIIAGPGRYYRNTRYIMAALTVVMGFWFGYDGFVRWPAEHQKVVELTQEAQTNNSPALRDELKSHTDHSETDILLQRILAFALPPLGTCLLLWALYNSRGEYRLVDQTLLVPGHPPVPLSAIRELDESAWNRKGIAKVAYELSDARRSGNLKLDDFVYERRPTDQIYDRIKAHLLPPVDSTPLPVDGASTSSTQALP
jgi:hypothetical protein